MFIIAGPTLQNVDGQCHQGARNAFNANSAWSNPAQFCARYSQANYEITLGNSGHTRVVWVTDYFQEMDTPTATTASAATPWCATDPRDLFSSH